MAIWEERATTAAPSRRTPDQPAARRDGPGRREREQSRRMDGNVGGDGVSRCGGSSSRRGKKEAVLGEEDR